MLEPYDFQKTAIDAALSHALGGDSPIIDCATGGGKSVIAAVLAERLIAEGKSGVLITCPSRELVVQNVEALRDFTRIPPEHVGVHCAALKRKDEKHPIIVGTPQSLSTFPDKWRRRRSLIIDEVHIGIGDRAKMLPSIIDNMHDEHVRIGLSATPYTLKGGMLHLISGSPFNTLAARISTIELISRGFLSPVRSSIAQLTFDTAGVAIATTGDYDLGALARVCDQEYLNRDVVAETIKRADQEQRQSVMVFAINRQHARHLAEDFEAQGWPCEYVDGKIDGVSRSAALRRFAAGETRFIVSVAALTTGVNIPRVDMIVLARPTQSTSLYVQMVGRGLRKHPGKEYCRLLDFGANLNLHGRPENPRVFTSSLQRPKGEKKEKDPFFEDVLDELIYDAEIEEAIAVASIIDLDDETTPEEALNLPPGYVPVLDVSWSANENPRTKRISIIANLKTQSGRFSVVKPALTSEGEPLPDYIQQHACGLLRHLTLEPDREIKRLKGCRDLDSFRRFVYGLNSKPVPKAVKAEMKHGYRTIVGSVF